MHLKKSQAANEEQRRLFAPRKEGGAPATARKLPWRTRPRRSPGTVETERRDFPSESGPKAAGEGSRACSGPSPPALAAMAARTPGPPCASRPALRTWSLWAAMPPLPHRWKRGRWGGGNRFSLFSSSSRHHEAGPLDGTENSTHRLGMQTGEPHPGAARGSGAPSGTREGQ